MAQWAVGKLLEDVRGIRTLRAALEQLLETPLEVPVHRERSGWYKGETTIVGIDGLARCGFLEVACVSDGIRVGYECLPFGEFSPEKPFPDVETLYVQYRQSKTGLEILGVSTESIAAMVVESLPSERQPGMRAEGPVATASPVPTRDADLLEEQSPTPAADVPTAEEVRRRPSRELLQTNTELYLAQCIEQRLRDSPQLYDVATNTVTFPQQRQARSLGDTLSYSAAAGILGKTPYAVWQWKKKKNLLIRHGQETAGMKVEDLLCVYLADVSRKKSYSSPEIAGFFGASEQDIKAIPAKYFPFPVRHSHQKDRRLASEVRKRFRESFTCAIDALREGKSLLEEAVLEENCRGYTGAEERPGATVPQLEKQGVQYDPEALVTELWVIYRVGAVPGKNKSMKEAKDKIFGRRELQPVAGSRRRQQWYRTGDFQDEDFKAYEKTARDVLTNPYICERDPEELLGPSQISRELGVNPAAATHRLQKLGVKPVRETRTAKRYRRADIHKKLGLPGWLSGDAQAPAAEKPIPLPKMTEYRIPSRQQPPLRNGIYEYGLRYESEPPQEAARIMVGAYKREFQRRLLEKFIEQGTLLGNEIFLGRGPQQRAHTADGYVALTDVAHLFRIKESVLSRAVRNVPHNLRRGASISPFAALVLYSPIEQPDHRRQPENTITYVGKKHALDALLIDNEKDRQLVAYLDEAGIARALQGSDASVMSFELFTRIYRPLSQQWALVMDSTREKGLLMQEINYVDETAALNILQRRGRTAEAAYHMIERLRNAAVLGMVHLGEVEKAAVQ